MLQPQATLSLRACTLPAHKALEATRLARALMSPALCLGHYRAILQAWAQAWAALEAALQTSVGHEDCGTLCPAPRSELAHDDLADLDTIMARPGSKQAWLAGCHEPMAPARCAAELLGLCYVAQGALLGGRVIAQHVQSTLHLPQGCATRFFAPPQAPPVTWTNWLRAFDQRIDTPKALSQAQEGALRTFNHLRCTFDHAAQMLEAGAGVALAEKVS